MPTLMEIQLKDEQIAILVQQGDKEKFGMLVDRFEAKLLRYGQKFLASQNNIEDIVQEIFIKTYQNIRSFDSSQKFSSWIYRIAHNEFINALKKKIRNPLYFFDFDTLLPHAVSQEADTTGQDRKIMQNVLKQSLEKLSPHYREIIVLYYQEELSYKEIADILHIPQGTVGIRLKRAKAHLQKLLPADLTTHL